MKKLILILCAGLLASPAFAGNFNVKCFFSGEDFNLQIRSEEIKTVHLGQNYYTVEMYNGNIKYVPVNGCVVERTANLKKSCN